ncbi:hypothetical protein ACFQZO_28300 [Bradyrhizobium sp. GCM10027634]|uniref:hypothetical protein n=1 Tax=unclassified Bradyrhizobium TaxID=2631580 RepID=UPI00188C91F6|nr:MULTISPECIES: hypothetical protein [unclassified Bradyrhizobium]MDN5004759.1 hypothetical protein [Bradyrhizobium sp. WYCCWR 12677]QOZ45301.1 hypothetical protein XH89_18830 [Bradyrhizobium sp. CCBAU 53340]
MKFVLVNHEPPLRTAACSACSRPIQSGYVRHVRTQLRYCDYDCYRRGELATLLMQWPMPAELAAGNIEAAARSMMEMFAVLSAVSCWSCTIQIWTVARALTGAFLDGRDLITTEGGDT